MCFSIGFAIDAVSAKIRDVFFHKLGICEAVFVAGMDMIRGHSDLILSWDIVVDNKDT